MAYEQNPYNIKISAVADPGLAAQTNLYTSAPMSLYRFVKIGTSNSATNVGPTFPVTALTSNTDRALGVLQNTPNVYYSQSTGALEGQGECEVTLRGITKVKVGGYIATLTPSAVSGVNITVSSTDSLEVGMSVVNTGASVNTTIASITSETVFTVASGTGITTSTALTIGTTGGNITLGDVITSDATGGAVKVIVGTDLDQYVLGTALSSGVAGDVITVALNCVSARRAS